MEFIVILVICGGLYYWFKRHQENQERERLAQTLSIIRSEIKSHKRTLAIKLNQMVYKDDYGNYIFDKWEREVKYFIENVLIKNNSIYQFLLGGIDSFENQARFDTVTDMVFEIANAESVNLVDESSNENVDELSGEEFEDYCVSILNQHGWDARITQSTGDQGIDIIGEINGVTAVFQCKRYLQPVGNSAVQEVIAGKNFAKAQIAAVITNSTFTKSARQLAQAANIYLLHHTELEEFTEILFSEE